MTDSSCFSLTVLLTPYKKTFTPSSDLTIELESTCPIGKCCPHNNVIHTNLKTPKDIISKHSGCPTNKLTPFNVCCSFSTPPAVRFYSLSPYKSPVLLHPIFGFSLPFIHPILWGFNGLFRTAFTFLSHPIISSAIWMIFNLGQYKRHHHGTPFKPLIPLHPDTMHPYTRPQCPPYIQPQCTHLQPSTPDTPFILLWCYSSTIIYERGQFE